MDTAALIGRPLGQILIKHKLISPGILVEALQQQRALPHQRLGTLLEQRGALTAAQLARALSAQLGVAFVETIDVQRAPAELMDSIPPSFAQKHLMVPIALRSDGVIIAVADPLNTEALEDLSQLLCRRLHTAVATPQAIEEALHALYTGRRTTPQLLEHEEETELPPDLLYSETQAPAIEEVNALLISAVQEGASDLHLEPDEAGLTIRKRIDGVLHDHRQLSPSWRAPVIARVKVIAGMDIAEKMRAQDGRIRRRIAGRDIDVRVSAIPNVDGERLVLRILDRRRGLKELPQLGLRASMLADVEDLLAQPQGVLLLSGPTGSGKTTTLYAALAHKSSRAVNIMTIEDPVEYRLSGISQTQTSKTGLKFAQGLRAFLRQDPDVIMVGEIRDEETAEVTIRAALTGHLVLSTVHTNDAPSAILRMLDLQVEPFALSEALLGVLAQRLVRRLCTSCAFTRAPNEAERSVLGDAHVLDGEGCEACRETGFSGRLGLYELLRMNAQLREALRTGQKAVGAPGTTLFADGTARVRDGQTTLAEVMRVAPHLGERAQRKPM